jgi:hypothetical protein
MGRYVLRVTIGFTMIPLMGRSNLAGRSFLGVGQKGLAAIRKKQLPVKILLQAHM